jgi:hypothetical protein
MTVLRLPAGHVHRFSEVVINKQPYAYPYGLGYGFHHKRVDIGTEKERTEAQIVVPGEAGLYNRIVAARKPGVTKDSMEYVLHDPTDVIQGKEYEYVSLQSENRGKEFDWLKLFGTGKLYNQGLTHLYDTAPVYLYARLKESKKTLARARLWLMPDRTYKVKIHFVADSKNPVETRPASVPTSVAELTALKKNIEEELNRIWIQANVRFEVEVQGGVSEVDYDKNPVPNKMLDYEKYDTNGDGKVDDNDRYEYMSIRDQLNQISSNYTIHVYYVKSISGFRIANSKAYSVLGFAGLGADDVFICDAGRDTLAHELGHILGLEHNNDKAYYPNSTDESKANPYRFNQMDPDWSDRTSLMWYMYSPGARHIGSPFWKRLNELRCDRIPVDSDAYYWRINYNECREVDKYDIAPGAY